MNPSSVYDEIAARTGGNIYIGVVGPVRTGKSTFIKRFLETIVLPNIPESYDRERARDEMPHLELSHLPHRKMSDAVHRRVPLSSGIPPLPQPQAVQQAPCR
jgi:GTPase SAR1 family protein